MSEERMTSNGDGNIRMRIKWLAIKLEKPFCWDVDYTSRDLQLRNKVEYACKWMHAAVHSKGTSTDMQIEDAYYCFICMQYLIYS